jgi:hypothetical protein
MAYLTIVTPTALVDKAPFRSSGLISGSILYAGDACYVGSDGLVTKTLCVSGTTGSAVEFDGICLNDTPLGGAVTLFGVGSRLKIASGMTIGTRYWSGSALHNGLLSNTCFTTTEGEPICKAVSATDVVVTRKY